VVFGVRRVDLDRDREEVVMFLDRKLTKVANLVVAGGRSQGLR